MTPFNVSSINQENSLDVKGSSPLDQLCIYYLEGKIGVDEAELGADFIGNWEEEGYSFLFFSASADDIVQHLCQCPPFPRLADVFYMSYAQWLGGAFTTSVIGSFTIVPPWETIPAEPPEQLIILDPGLVFGAGNHPTTRDCILALETAFQMNHVDTVMDLGTGTGLLSIAAARLGAGFTTAVDFNALAVKTTQRNIRLNGLTDKVMSLCADAQQFVENKADLLLANIHYAVMKNIIVSPGFTTKKAFILSGLMRSEAQDIAASLKRLPVKIVRQWDSDGIWTTFFGTITT